MTVSFTLRKYVYALLTIEFNNSNKNECKFVSSVLNLDVSYFTRKGNFNNKCKSDDSLFFHEF